MRVKDVDGLSHIIITEKKTDKKKRALINGYLREQIDRFINNMTPEEYLFRSRKGINRPITRTQAYRILSKAAKAVGLDEVGTHTLRKTFGYHHYQQHKEVAILQELFNQLLR